MSEAVSSARIDEAIALLDARLGSVLDDVLHHPGYQALEAAWRGIAHVVSQVAFDQNIRVEICHYPAHELKDDLSEAAGLTRSWLFRTVYSAEYGQFGGKPYGAIFLDYATTSSAVDVAFLRRLAAVAAAAHAPVFLAAHPSLLRLESFDELPYATDLASAFDGPSSVAWNSLIESEDSRYLGVLLPRMLLRAPWRDTESPASRFVYDERTTGAADMLWGSPGFAFAVRLAEAFAAHRSYLGMLDDAAGDEPPVLEWHPALARDAPKPSVEVVISSRVELQLSELGFIPLSYDSFRSKLRFRRAPSLQRARTFGSSEGGEAATLNFLLGTRFPYSLLASRFAHYLKVIERERIGASATRAETERELNEWLRQFVVALDGVPPAVRLKYPLRAARVRLSDVEGEAGWYRMEVLLQSHIKYLGQAVILSVAGRIETR